MMKDVDNFNLLKKLVCCRLWERTHVVCLPRRASIFRVSLPWKHQVSQIFKVFQKITLSPLMTLVLGTCKILFRHCQSVTDVIRRFLMELFYLLVCVCKKYISHPGELTLRLGRINLSFNWVAVLAESMVFCFRYSNSCKY